MKAVATVTQAYGFHLGNPDGWEVEEAGSFGTLNLDWYCDVGRRGICDELVDAATDHLKTQGAMDGIIFLVHGDLTAGSADEYLLIAARDSYTTTTDWGDSLSMAPQALLWPELNDWDTRLAKALTALGLTPYQKQPRWHFAACLR